MTPQLTPCRHFFFNLQSAENGRGPRVELLINTLPSANGDDDGDSDDDDSDNDDGNDSDCDDNEDDGYSCLVLNLATLPAALPFFIISPNMVGANF